MFKKFIGTILIALLLISFSNCTKKEEKIVPTKKLENKSESTTSFPKKSSPEIQKQTVSTVLENKKEIVTTNETITSEKKVAKTTVVPGNYKIYNNLNKIINSIKTGQTVTTEQLLATNKFPEDAGKTVKSITKVSENEMDIKWKSKWMVESISDVQLEDSRLKVVFKNGIVYTSGKAIGIDYNGKTYNNLIIKGDRAYIPNVKKYSWKIGR